MITELKVYGSQENYGKVWCKTCPKTLLEEHAEDYGMEALEQAAVDALLGMAAYHERLHKTHDITVTVYERTPIKNT